MKDITCTIITVLSIFAINVALDFEEFWRILLFDGALLAFVLVTLYRMENR